MKFNLTGVKVEVRRLKAAFFVWEFSHTSLGRGEILGLIFEEVGNTPFSLP
jgi:hypothetical protein